MNDQPKCTNKLQRTPVDLAWPGGSCQKLDQLDSNHKTSMALKKGIVPASLNGRAADLSGAMQSLLSIKPILSRKYLIKGWLDRGGASVAYGAPNVGTAFFALDLAFHVAAGAPWHRAKVAGHVGKQCKLVPKVNDWGITALKGAAAVTDTASASLGRCPSHIVATRIYQALKARGGS